jgi:hypothetical protein
MRVYSVRGNRTCPTASAYYYRIITTITIEYETTVSSFYMSTASEKILRSGTLWKGSWGDIPVLSKPPISVEVSFRCIVAGHEVLRVVEFSSNDLLEKAPNLFDE